MALRLVRGVGIIGRADENSSQPVFKMIKDLDTSEFEECERAVRAVSQVSASLQLQLIERNRMRLSSIGSFYRNAIELRARSEHFDPRRAVENLSFEMINWLTATRLFLDHHLTLFSRTYGNNSAQHRRLKQAISVECDSSAAYRILYKLRDYTQHCGFPVDRVTSTAKDPSVDDWSARAEFTADRDRLLGSFDWNAKTREDLAEVPDRIDVLGLVKSASPAFRRIFAEVTRIRLEEMADSVKKIREMAALSPGNDVQLSLLSFTVGSNNIPTEIGFTSIPVHLVGWFDDPAGPSGYLDRLEVDATFDSVSETLSPNAMTDGTQESLRIGAAVMNVYYESGGTNDQFGDRVNKIADDLGDITPVLVGTTVVAAVALSMAAAALGTNARDIAGSFAARP